MGLDIYLCSKKDGQIVEGAKDPVYPDHLFTPAYLRSSYNDSGIDEVLREFCGTSLSEIFDHSYDKHVSVGPKTMWRSAEQSVFIPDWDLARKNTQKALDTLRAVKDPFRATFVADYNIKKGEETNSKEKALKRFKEAYESAYSDTYPLSLRSFSNGYGVFDVEGWTVHAIMPGIKGGHFMENTPGAWVIYKMDLKIFQRYPEFLEIALRFIEKGQKEDLAIVWSG